MDLLKGKVRAQPLQLNLRELRRVIPQIAIPQQYVHRHNVNNEYTVPCCRHQVDVQSIETKLNTT